jgi:hypothetical protein
MATIWLTYAWDDNQHRDVDFVAQELVNYGVDVRRDRWNLRAGLPLWEQIEHFIQNEEQCNAWVLFATQNSLGSERCREEFRYALDRALNVRGNAFPIIGLFREAIDPALIPAAIRVRLYVSLAEPDWKERISAAAEGRGPVITQQVVPPFYIELRPNGNEGCIIEVRPRAGTWSPFIVAIPVIDGRDLIVEIACGPSGQPPMGDFQIGPFEGISDDGQWFYMGAQNQATPIQSYFIFCRRRPSKLLFGSRNGDTYIVDINLL